MTYVGHELIGNSAVSWYRIDLNRYVENLQYQISDTTRLELEMPTRQWSNSSSFETFYASLINNLALILDYIIWIINIIIYPMRLGGYMMRFFIALLGINTDSTSSLYWLGQFMNNLISMAIPYI